MRLLTSPIRSTMARCSGAFADHPPLAPADAPRGDKARQVFAPVLVDRDLVVAKAVTKLADRGQLGSVKRPGDRNLVCAADAVVPDRRGVSRGHLVCSNVRGVQ
jgi:hypothetical protein